MKPAPAASGCGTSKDFHCVRGMARFLGVILALAAVHVTVAPRSARALDITGKYTGTATLAGGISVSLSVTLSQNGTAVSGTLTVRGFDCLTALGFSGTLSGTTLSGSFTGASTIALSGTVSGNQLSGTFDISVAPCATTGSGPFALTKVTPTGTLTKSPPAAATPTPKPQVASDCVGDCNGNDEVTVDELITGVNIAVGNTALSACAVLDQDDDTQVTVNELITAVNDALIGCPPPGLAGEVASNTQTDRKADDFMRGTTADDPVNKRMGDTLAFVKAQPGVVDASLFPDGLTILIAHTNGLKSALMLIPDFPEDATTAFAATALTRPWSTGTAADATDVPTNAVLVQGRDLANAVANDHFTALEGTLHGMGFGLGRSGEGVEVVREAGFTTDFFRTDLGKYQILYIIAHGGNDGSQSAVALGSLGKAGASFPSPAGLDAVDVNQKRLLTAITSRGIFMQGLIGTLRLIRFETGPIPRYLATPAFIAKYYKGETRLARDSLVYLDACDLFLDVPRALADAGAAAVLYFSGTETTQVGTPPIDRAFFAALAAGKSVDEAIDAAKAGASRVTLGVYPPEGGKLRFIPLNSVDFSLPCDPEVNKEVTFTQDKVGPDNAQIAKWVWDFGDHDPPKPEESTFLPASSTNTIRHTFTDVIEDRNMPGYSKPYTVTLTATDLFGHQVKAQKQLRVRTEKRRLTGGMAADGSCPTQQPCELDRGGVPRCDDPASDAALLVQPSQGFIGVSYTVGVTITGPAAPQVLEVEVRIPDRDEIELLPRQPDGSFQNKLFFGGFTTIPLFFAAYDAHGILCCGETNVTSLGFCTNNGDCGAGAVCLNDACLYSECREDGDCGVGRVCAVNGICHAQ